MTALNSGRFVTAHVRSAADGETGFDTTVAQASVFEANGASANIRFPATSVGPDPILLADAGAVGGSALPADVERSSMSSTPALKST